MNNAQLIAAALRDINHFHHHMNSKTKIIIGAVVVAAIYFYGGYSYGSSKTAQASTGRMMFTNGAGGGFRTGGMRNGGFTAGSIISKDDQSVTLKLQDGGSRIVFFSGTTQIMKSAAGTPSDLTVGENVMVTGSQNSDGSLTAQSIQVRPPRMATSTSAQ